MIKILSPNTDYNGISAGITFKNGVAELATPNLSESIMQYLQAKGYSIIDTEEKTITKKAKK